MQGKIGLYVFFCSTVWPAMYAVSVFVVAFGCYVFVHGIAHARSATYAM